LSYIIKITHLKLNNFARRNHVYFAIPCWLKQSCVYIEPVLLSPF